MSMEELEAAQAQVERVIQSITLQRFLALLVNLGGIKGTLAVVGAAALHLDPFGGFRWDGADVALGLALASPILILDAALMVPAWEASWTPAGQSGVPDEAREPPRDVRVLSSADGVPPAAVLAGGADPEAVAQVASPLAPEKLYRDGAWGAARDTAALFQRLKVRVRA